MSTKQLSALGAVIKGAYEGQPDTNAFTNAEKSKLGGIQAGAEANTVDSVAGKNGDVLLNKDDVGLANVDNTSDANKPVSNLVQDALDDKQDILIPGNNIAIVGNTISAIGPLVFPGDNTGATDVATTLKAFIENAAGKDVYIPAGIYRMDATLDANGSWNVECSPNAVFMVGLRPFISTDLQTTYVRANSAQLTVTSITKEVAPDGFNGTTDTDYVTVLNVTATGGFTINDFAYSDVVVVGSSDAHPGGGGRMSEATKIRWVDAAAGKIYLVGALNQGAYYLNNIYVNRYPTARSFNWRGGKVKANADWRNINLDAPTGEHAHAIYLRNFPYAEISDMEFEGIFEGAIVVWNSPFCKLDNIVGRNLPNLRTQTTTLGANAFATDMATNSGGNTTIVVTDPGHTYINNQPVIFAGASTFNGVSNTLLNGSHNITVISPSSYSFVVAGTAAATGSGGGSGATSGMNGRLGYILCPYGHSGGLVATNITGFETRHIVTTGGQSATTFSKVNWTGYGQPTNCSFDQIFSYGCYGIPIDTHEEGDRITFSNVKIFFSLQGPQGGSYNGYGTQNRASNVRISNYYQFGGYGGIRIQATEVLAGSIHQFDNIFVEGTSEVANNDAAIRVEDLSGITSRTKIRFGKIASRNCGATVHVNGGGADIFFSELEALEIGARLMRVVGSATAANKIISAKTTLDYSANPRSQSRQQICEMVQADTVHLGALHIIMGATTAAPPRVFHTSSGSVAGKKVGYSSLTFIDPSGVGKLEPYSSLTASQYTWIGGGEVLNLTVVDSGTAIAAATGVAKYVMPQRFQVIDFMAQVKTQSSSGVVTFDVNKNGTSMMGTNKLSIDANEDSSLTAATPYDVNSTGAAAGAATAFSMLARGDTVTVDVDAAGTGAAGGMVSVRGFWC